MLIFQLDMLYLDNAVVKVAKISPCSSFPAFYLQCADKPNRLNI